MTTWPKFQWLRKSALNSPAVFINSVAKCLYTHTDFLRPFFHGETFSVKSEDAVVGPIIRLLFLRSPSAIPRFISFRIVNAIDCGAVRTFAHISKEIAVIIPAITYPFFNVFWALGCVRIAPPFHRNPRAVCGSSCNAASFWSVTATGSCVPASKGRSLNRFNITAVTLAKPKKCFPPSWCGILGNYNNFSKSLTLNVLQMSLQNKYYSKDILASLSYQGSY